MTVFNCYCVLQDLAGDCVQQLVLSLLSEQTNRNGIVHALDLCRDILSCKETVNLPVGVYLMTGGVVCYVGYEL